MQARHPNTGRQDLLGGALAGPLHANARGGAAPDRPESRPMASLSPSPPSLGDWPAIGRARPGAVRGQSGALQGGRIGAGAPQSCARLHLPMACRILHNAAVSRVSASKTMRH